MVWLFVQITNNFLCNPIFIFFFSTPWSWSKHSSLSMWSWCWPDYARSSNSWTLFYNYSWGICYERTKTLWYLRTNWYYNFFNKNLNNVIVFPYNINYVLWYLYTFTRLYNHFKNLTFVSSSAVRCWGLTYAKSISVVRSTLIFNFYLLHILTQFFRWTSL